MSHSITSKHADILNTQLNTEENPSSKSSKLIEREQLTGTPFWLVGNEEQGYRIIMGKWAITEIYKTKIEALLIIKDEQWQTTLKLAGIVAQDLIEQNEKRKISSL